MISDRMYLAAGKFFRFSAWMGVMPWNWDCSARRLIRSHRCHFYSRIHFLHFCVGILLYLLMCLSSYLDGNRKDFNFSYSITLLALLILQVWIIMIFWEDEIFLAINSFFFYVEHINRKFFLNYKYALKLELKKLYLNINFRRISSELQSKQGTFQQNS